MRVNNIIGDIGEEYVSHTLHRVIGKDRLFRVTPLGAKYELFDFMVNIIDTNGGPTGHFFLLQVKAQAIDDFNEPLKVEFTKEEVQMVKLRKVPSYLVGVQVKGNRQRGYFIALDCSRTAGVYRVPKTHILKNDSNLLGLCAEVSNYFDQHANIFSSKFI
ncbi:hypothetical protein [Pseudomonas viridiflava]|uniref:hypothetical protein n=1 Tax=Pseudomonas viridiflava TaxID=33069 RepID=UPI0013CE45A8|nr:hypothetical protein [Pseudomonas viridiflava]